jgi:2-polyprenyl-3-methyl-5-hydroxy-6-metoxy-1,4-benzoquinol methylase
MTDPAPIRLEAYVSRMELFSAACRGRKVLHLGCSSGRYIQDRITRGTFLHEILSKQASHLAGLDLDKDSLATMTSLGYTNLYHGNAEELDHSGIHDHFEVIVAGDLLEHITRPGSFLDSAKGLLSPGGQLILSTNNAFGLHYQIKRWLGRYEEHFEHVCFYSPETLVHLFERHGYRVTSLFGAFTVPPHTLRQKIQFVLGRPLFKIFPVLAGTIIVVAEASRAYQSNAR